MVSVLGISIGTRNVGIAVIRLRSLTDYRIRTFAGRWTRAKCDSVLHVVGALIQKYGITDITVKIPRPSHRSENLGELLDGIKGFRQVRNVRVYPCTLEDIKLLYAVDGRASKRLMVAALIEKYPELGGEWHNGKRAHSYNAKLFEAIACAELALRAGH